LIFVPLSTTAVATLSNEQIGNASGLYNFLRNIGASIGISVVDTMLARRQQVHRNELSRYLAPTGVAQQTFLKLQSYLSLHAGPRLARLRAYALIQNGLDRQSILYSYVDDLRYMVVVCAICLPIVFMLRPAKAKAGATPAGH
jgi:DHA2 family multidrug resistance protein